MKEEYELDDMRTYLPLLTYWKLNLMFIYVSIILVVLLLQWNAWVSAVLSGYWRLNRFLSQAFLVRMVARHSTELKTSPVKWQKKLLVGATDI